MSNSSNNKENQQKPKLDFWDPILNSTNEAKERPFPKDLISQKQMDFIQEKLFKRIDQYENHKCFGYLNKFKQYFDKSLSARTEEDYEEIYTKARMSLRLFSFCWEREKQIEKQKIMNQY